MRVLYVYQGDWPRNATRVLKQTRALAEAGHVVRLLSGNPRGEPRHGVESWMDVERVPRLGPPALSRYLGFPVFVNPFWLAWIHRAARRFKAECLIVRDLPLAPAALAVGRVLGLPVHYEMADVYPVAMRANRADHPGLISRFTRNPRAAEWLDRAVIRRAASIFVVSEESRQRCLALGAADEATVIVGNTPASLPSLDGEAPIPADLADWAGRPLILFVGNLLADRGLPEAIDAMAEVRRAVADVGLVIIGDGREHAALAARIDARDLRDHVRLLGWKPPADHAAYYRHARIGILPFLSTEHINITLANKLFDYMGAALPIVATDVAPMRRVLAETGAGVLVAPGDAHALAAALVALLRDPERCRALGARGRAAVSGQYAWARDRERLLAAVTRTTPRD
ncbi:MAG TPA: glycosyltransferase family 4 protein [Gemmatimonadaceae bacterium]|nr:glycosyltransferase family 4 protein [Gemmatimonadaceae bacterium]